MQEFDDNLKHILIKTARDSISYGLRHHEPLKANLPDYPAKLQQNLACFVTLHLHGTLRGCIGSLQARQPLILDVAHNAFNAAFSDPRFPPLTLSELGLITLDISVLSTPEPMHFSSEADLLAQLRPGIDGLILSDGGHRGTFLPSVWSQLPRPEDFLRHLKNKAGLPIDYWSKTIKVERYTTELIT